MREGFSGASPPYVAISHCKLFEFNILHISHSNAIFWRSRKMADSGSLVF